MYKWVDTKKLMNYGLENYSYQDVYEKDIAFEPIEILGGVPREGGRNAPAYAGAALSVPEDEQSLPILLRQDEEVEVIYQGRESLPAPVTAGEQVGKVTYRLGDLVLAEYPVLLTDSVEKLDFTWCLLRTVERYLL